MWLPMQGCGLDIRGFWPRPHHEAEVVLLWHRASTGLVCCQEAAQAVVSVATVLGLDMNPASVMKTGKRSPRSLYGL